jgi:transposase-like protein
MRTCEHDLVAARSQSANAVLELMVGKATVDQIARRLGVHTSAVSGWRDEAVAGEAEPLRRGSARLRASSSSTRRPTARAGVTKLSIQNCLLERALDLERAGYPTGPARTTR